MCRECASSTVGLTTISIPISISRRLVTCLLQEKREQQDYCRRCTHKVHTHQCTSVPIRQLELKAASVWSHQGKAAGYTSDDGSRGYRPHTTTTQYFPLHAGSECLVRAICSREHERCQQDLCRVSSIDIYLFICAASATSLWLCSQLVRSGSYLTSQANSKAP